MNWSLSASKGTACFRDTVWNLDLFFEIHFFVSSTTVCRMSLRTFNVIHIILLMCLFFYKWSCHKIMSYFHFSALVSEDVFAVDCLCVFSLSLQDEALPSRWSAARKRSWMMFPKALVGTPHSLYNTHTHTHTHTTTAITTSITTPGLWDLSGRLESPGEANLSPHSNSQNKLRWIHPLLINHLQSHTQSTHLFNPMFKAMDPQTALLCGVRHN